MSLSVIIVDDEEKMGQLIARGLERQGWSAQAFTQPELALDTAEARPPDVLLTDLKMPGMSGLDVLERARRTIPNTTVVLMTAYASAQSAIEALKMGAYDYLIKPFPIDELTALLDRLAERSQLKRENRQLRETLGSVGRFEGIVGASPAMQTILDVVRRVARSDASVLLRGESGTGKEVIATAIHSASPRADGPLIRVNCGAIPETLLESALFGHRRGSFTGADRDRDGYFQAAHGGTLFLDEIGEIAPSTQVKLLRALQEGTIMPVGANEQLRVDVRIIAATNRNLEAAIEDGTFRRDLYYRLNVVPIVLPSLRSRREDILPLIDFFLARLAERGQQTRPFGAAALDAMRRYHWPGNVRELQNAVEHAVVLATGDEIQPSDLPHAVYDAAGVAGSGTGLDAAGAGSLDGMTLEEVERIMIVRALELSDGNQTHAARRLGVTRRTLGYRMARHGIPSPAGPARSSDAHEAISDDELPAEEVAESDVVAAESSKRPPESTP